MGALRRAHAFRVAVMSRRPGRIIDEIEIDLPHRENPIACCQDAKVHDDVWRLMERLDVGEIAHGAG